ncbi:DUF6745 domain-containing protein [Actinomadura sp. 9N407]|uniref:DUF6745 domain-containing protein n=1 Tax=Actinomadura sp. 9N407 TaxID=3375154 RepID=UPI0037A04900
MTAGRPSDEHRRSVDESSARWAARAAGADRAEAERGVTELYRAAGLEPPKAFVWLDSPVAGAVAAWTLMHGHGHPRLAEHPQARTVWAEAGTAPQGLPATSEPDAYGLAEEAARHIGWEPWSRLQDEIARQVAQPTWAMPSALVEQWRLQTIASGDAAYLARVHADVTKRLAERLPPLVPAGSRDAVRDALQDHGAGPRSTDEQWQEIWQAARAPSNPVPLVSAAFLATVGATVSEPVDAFMRIAAAIGWWWALDGVALLTPPPPELHTDSRGVPHRADGPAIRFADGLTHYFWHGHMVPPDLIAPGWSASDIAEASDDELQGRAARQLGPGSFTGRLPAKYVVPDLRRCAVERLGWSRFAAEAALPPVTGPAADPHDPGTTLTLYDVPEAVFGRPARVVVRTGGTADGTGLLVPTDADDPVAAAAWLGGDGPEPAPEPALLRRIRESPDLTGDVAGLDFELGPGGHVEDVHLISGSRLEAIGGHGTGGTYFLCGDGPRRPLLYADSEGGAQVLGRDLTEALELMVSAHPDDGDPEEADEEAAGALGLTPLEPEAYRARHRAAETMAAALTLIMTVEGNGYEYRRGTWFR